MVNGGACEIQQAVMLVLGRDAMKRESFKGHGSEDPQKTARGKSMISGVGVGSDLERLFSETVQV